MQIATLYIVICVTFDKFTLMTHYDYVGRPKHGKYGKEGGVAF